VGITFLGSNNRDPVTGSIVRVNLNRGFLVHISAWAYHKSSISQMKFMMPVS